MKSDSFFKVYRNKKLIEISDKPIVLAILVKLGLFTKRDGGEDGKFVLIQWKKMGITEQQFRTAKDYILNNGLATFRRTFGGTEFCLNSKAIIDINEEQTTDPTTDKQRNHNNKNIKQEDITRKKTEENFSFSQKKTQRTGTTEKTLHIPPTPTRPEVHIDLYELARDNPWVADKLVSMGVV